MKNKKKWTFSMKFGPFIFNEIFWIIYLMKFEFNLFQKTAIIIAVEKNNATIVDLLLSFGEKIDVNIPLI